MEKAVLRADERVGSADGVVEEWESGERSIMGRDGEEIEEDIIGLILW